jgi:type II secretory pathway component GspD/PulD (secretin)
MGIREKERAQGERSCPMIRKRGKARGRPMGKKALFRLTVPVVLFLTILGATRSSAETLVYPMQYRTAAEAVPMVQPLLSPVGRAVADARTNALLVVDDEEAIQRVREFLAGFDKPGKMARIRVRFDESGTRETTSVEGSARASGEDWSASAGKPMAKDGVSVRLQDRSRLHQGSSEFFVTVVSGGAAYIMVGQDILYTQRWVDLTRRYARITEAVTIQRIETGFEVMPVILKDHADLEITPRISHGGPRPGVIRFMEASTRLVAPIGQWVTIGGASEQSNDVIRAVLEAGRGERRSVTSISLLVEPPN